MTQIFVKYILHLCIFRQMTKNRTPTPVYLDPGMHPGLEVKGLTVFLVDQITVFGNQICV